MIWVLPALGAALSVATADFLIKRHFSDRPFTEVAVLRFLSLCPMSLVLLALAPPAPVQPGFWLSIAGALPGEIAATFLYLRAIQVSPLALTQPFLVFTPLFATLTGLLFLGEFPSGLGFMGIVLLVAGAYGLNLHQARTGWSRPFTAVLREPGSWMMLLVGLLYAYTAVLGRQAVLQSSPWFMLSVYPLVVTSGLVAVSAAAGRLSWGWMSRPGPALAVALSMTAMSLCHFWAISMVQAAYMISVKRLSILFAMLYGGLFLGEARLGQHLAAGSLMLGGAVLIMIFG